MSEDIKVFCEKCKYLIADYKGQAYWDRDCGHKNANTIEWDWYNERRSVLTPAEKNTDNNCEDFEKKND